MDTPSLVGKTLTGRYLIQEELGCGSLGKVYKAQHCLTDRQVAVKVMHGVPHNDLRAVMRFQREAKAASSLNHPNIVSVFDFGIAEEGYPFLVMDYLQGGSLDDRLAAEVRVPVEKALPIFIQICSALAHAHKRGVIHRDLKPTNIMIINTDEEADFVKIVDFGIAKRLDESQKTIDKLTIEGHVSGTPEYMSPEQCLGEKVDARADIYALGCVMFEALTGTAPISGETLLQTLSMHINGAPLTFEAACSDFSIPDPVQNIIYKTLKKKPEDRHQSMLELKADLASALESLRNNSLLVNRDQPRQPEKPAGKTIGYYRKSADSGDAFAQYQIGRMFYEGDSVEQSLEQALEWYLRAANNGCADAQVALGWLHNNGEKLPRNFAEAAKWFQLAAEAGNAEAQNCYGCHLEFGLGIPQDRKQAVSWFNKAIKQGWPTAYYNLGRCYYYGTGVEQDYDRAVELLMPGAESGDSWAEWLIGECYTNGHGLPQDIEKAAEWYLRSAEHGHGFGQCSIGVCYATGSGVPQDSRQALRWFKESAATGYPAAQYNVGRCYENGEGTQSDAVRAIEWYRKAAENGHVDAQFRLGYLYSSGQGVEKNCLKAAEWWTKAADQGDADAQCLLGVLYETGDGVRVDLEEAVDLFKKAASQGDAEAQTRLARMYELGNGVEKDIATAIRWYKSAAAQGKQEAVSALKNLNEDVVV